MIIKAANPYLDQVTGNNHLVRQSIMNDLDNLENQLINNDSHEVSSEDDDDNSEEHK